MFAPGICWICVSEGLYFEKAAIVSFESHLSRRSIYSSKRYRHCKDECYGERLFILGHLRHCLNSHARVVQLIAVAFMFSMKELQANTHVFLFPSFVAANWRFGWLGQFMWGVFTNYLQLDPSEIVAMTTLNFTGATNPKNETSVYKGASSYTRCVWEVKIGNAVTACDKKAYPLSHLPLTRSQSARRTFASPISGRPRSEEASPP